MLYNTCNMYKPVNLREDTYNELNNIATQLNKPKGQAVETLIAVYKKFTKDQEQAKLHKFNREMGKLVKSLKLSKDIKISTDNLDELFAALADTDYGR